jgi:serine/threonine-protein kinase RsbW
MNPALSSSEKRASQPKFAGIQRSHSLLELEAWMPREIGAISPTVEQLMRFIERWRCVEGNEFAVKMALREALSNAVIHGNEMDPDKLVEVRCRCERGKGVWLVVKDHGNGLDPTAIPDPMASQGLQAEHGRGIHLMKFAMDEISFKRRGTEVHMRKGPSCKSRTEPPNDEERVSPDSADSIECEAAAAVREC